MSRPLLGIRPPIALGPTRTRRRAEAGLSLIEVLMATALLFGIGLGLIGLYVSSLRSNTYGTESSEVNNLVKTEIERLLPLPMNHPSLEVAVGTSETVLEDNYSEEDLGQLGTATWVNHAVTSTPHLKIIKWHRVTTIRQTAYDDIFFGTKEVDGNLLVQRGHPDIFDAPLDGNASADKIHFKEIETNVVGVRQSGPLGIGQDWTVRRFRAF